MRDSELDRVIISGLRARCVIGINDWERLVPQEIELDIALHADLRLAQKSDRIEDTVDYRTIARRVVKEVEKSSFGLVEALAGRVADVCLQDVLVQRVDVTLRKPGAVRGSDWVGVQISRDKSGAPVPGKRAGRK